MPYRNKGSLSIRCTRDSEARIDTYRIHDLRSGRSRTLRSIAGGAKACNDRAARESTPSERSHPQGNIPQEAVRKQAEPVPIGRAPWLRAMRRLPIHQLALRFRQMEGQFYNRVEYDLLVEEVGALYETEIGPLARLEFLSRLDGMLRQAGYQPLSIPPDWERYEQEVE